MGIVSESSFNEGSCGGGNGCFFKGLVRRKQVDSVHNRSSHSHHHQLAKDLTIPHLIAIGNALSLNDFVFLWRLKCFSRVFFNWLWRFGFLNLFIGSVNSLIYANIIAGKFSDIFFYGFLLFYEILLFGC